MRLTPPPRTPLQQNCDFIVADVWSLGKLRTALADFSARRAMPPGTLRSVWVFDDVNRVAIDVGLRPGTPCLFAALVVEIATADEGVCHLPRIYSWMLESLLVASGFPIQGSGRGRMRLPIWPLAPKSATVSNAIYILFISLYSSV